MVYLANHDGHELDNEKTINTKKKGIAYLLQNLDFKFQYFF